MKRFAVLALVIWWSGGPGAQAQDPSAVGQRQGRQQRLLQGRGQAIDNAGVTPAEIQRMFDAFALIQAQDQLELNDEQYARFLIRFKTLQDVRRQALLEHTRLVAELRRLLLQRQPDEARLKERVQALQDADAKAAADLRKAYENIDQVLDIRQQARFRVFEEQMDRRKLELVTRARQNRPNQQAPGTQAPQPPQGPPPQ
jgi:hypothetical protein